MALNVGVNSWVTVAEADSYLEDQLDSNGWWALPELPVNPGAESKSVLLITAARWLLGSPELELSITTSTANIKEAQIKSALFLQKHFCEVDDRTAAMYTGVTAFEYSKRNEDLDIKNLGIPADILALLPEYTISHAFVVLQGEYDV